jgi:protein-tyrosine phosphatase
MRNWLGFLGRKAHGNEDYSLLRTDVHSHLIPGIDDGAGTIEESLLLLRSLSRLGFRKVVTTPHIMEDFYRNTPDIITRGLYELRKAAREQDIQIEIEAAAEYYLDSHFIRLLGKEPLLTFGRNYLLFELSYINPPLNLEKILFEIQAEGYIPVLAHPERYRFWESNPGEYKKLKETGVLFMLNTNSFSGYYGKAALSLAFWMADNGLVDFLGSDVHHIKHIHSLKKALKQERLVRLMHQPLLNKEL